MKKNILGIQANFLNPDGVTNESSVSFVKDGELRTCIAEERLSHKKLEGKFPALAINEVLERENITIDDIDTIAVPFLHPMFVNIHSLHKLYIRVYTKLVSNLIACSLFLKLFSSKKPKNTFL